MKKYILVLLSMILLTISCGQNSAAKRAFEGHMKIVQSGDIEKLKKWDPVSEIDKVKFLLPGLKKITYKINKVEVKDKTAVVNVTMKYPNFGAYGDEFHKFLTEKYKSSNITDREQAMKITLDEAEKFFSEKIKNNNMKYLEKTIDVTLDKKGSAWDIEARKNLEFSSVLALGLDK